ncbi:MAG: glycosyltransferase family 39 protein [Nitrospirae bacterium YQR-1]
MIKQFYKYSASVILLIVTVFVLLQSPLAPFANNVVIADSGVFIYCAKEIISGKLIYKEVFDHKGPVIYLINIIGLTILNGNLTGIWLIEVISLFLAALYMFKTLRFFYDDTVAVISVVFLLLTLTPLLEGGNLTEEYALPFTALSGYILTGYTARQRTMGYTDTLLVAVCFTLTFLLRPNLVPLWVGFAVVICFSLIRERKYNDVLRYSLTAITGVFLTVLPFIVYAVKKNILSDAIFCFWEFNIAYSNTTLAKIISGAYKSTESVSKTSLMILVFIYMWHVALNFKKQDNKPLHTAVFLNIFLTMFISCGLSDRGFDHYAIAYIPVVCVAVAMCFSAISKYAKTVIFPVGIMLILTWHALVMHYYLINYAYIPKPYITQVVNFIQNTTGKDDRIAVIGNDSKLYFMSERASCSKYHYLSTILHVAEVSNVILREFCSDLTTKRPKLIVVESRLNMVGCIAETIAGDYNLKVKSRDGSMVIYSLK